MTFAPAIIAFPSPLAAVASVGLDPGVRRHPASRRRRSLGRVLVQLPRRRAALRPLPA